MASYGLRFKGEWLDKLGGESRFDILERDFTGSFETMVMQEDPLVLKMDEMKTKFVPTNGCGIDLNVVAQYDGQYMNLYTNDKQKYMYEFTKNGKLISRGFMNTEIYSEQYDRNKDYDVTLQFNDGFAVMERISFLDSNGERYRGLKTAWEVMWIILGKLGINYKYVYVACDVYEEGMDTLSSPYHQKKVNCANYYDEKGDPMNCREVFDELVKLQRAVCWQNEGCLNIVSVPRLAAGSFERRRYTSETSAQVLQTINPVITIPTQADWYESDQNLDVVSGFNKATLKYSPYGIENILASISPDIEGNLIGEGSWSNNGYYWEFGGVTAKGWNVYNGCKYSGSKESENAEKEEFYFSLPMQAAEDKMLETDLGDDLILSAVAKQTVLVKGKVYLRTKDNEYRSGEESVNIEKLTFKNTIEIAGERPIRDGMYLKWSVNNYYSTVNVFRTGSISDQWQDFSFRAPLDFKTGAFRWIMAGNMEVWDANGDKMNSDVVKEVRMKDVEVEIINLTTNDTGLHVIRSTEADFSDLEFVANMDENWLNEAEDIEMIHGDSKHNNCTDRGGLHLLDNSFTRAWRATGDTQGYDIAAIILRSLQSNYRNSLKWLGGTLEAPNFFNGDGENIDGILSFHSVLTYPGTSLGNRKLMCLGGTYNDKRQTLKGSWLEVLADDLTINMIE